MLQSKQIVCYPCFFSQLHFPDLYYSSKTGALTIYKLHSQQTSCVKPYYSPPTTPHLLWRVNSFFSIYLLLPDNIANVIIFAVLLLICVLLI